ncbi:uncharacterized protein PGTG_03950 [Puccinia graminis f. sp. tritici CRL 75-36-700-3]|uniref:No apical meristem-associated C-terminal domain-containing protein n=1 Tax=Puccinia graminis f. sp. tritici (strain CRL 75-36-700-3 / race SCCL) TaxID=418459 RepID=E3K119_PUCGT|nr:uncharacterized protein PGTG_03950 [Puccinia graminis f. sp. tritici CRL 75-36-700-3]EFP77994.1 hypothetical protein PGTG_03950 [Puccinia graminis f. sp. tritici CRL 75-36-700-3]
MAALDPLLLTQTSMTNTNSATLTTTNTPVALGVPNTPVINSHNNQSQAAGSLEEGDDSDSKRKKLSHYQEHEDVELCKAWIAITEDARIGTDQSGATRAITQPKRPQKSVKSRWGLLQKDINKFQACVIQVENMNQSGASVEDLLNMALELYSENQGSTFYHIRCYNILVKCPKWHDYFRQNTAKKNSKKRARSPSSEVPQSLPTSEPATSTTAEDRLVAEESQTDTATDRPIGKKKAKAIHRSKMEGDNDWKEEVAAAQKEIATQANHQNNIADIKAQSMKSIANTAKTNAITAIMTKDLTGCTPTAQKYFELKQQQILESLESNN